MNNPLLVFVQQRIQKPGLPLQHEPNPSAWHLRKTNCTLHQHSSVLQTWTRSDLRLLSELLSGKTTFLDIPFCLLSRTQSSPDRADSVAGEECTFNSFWFHNSLCIVIIYHIACASFLPPPTKKSEYISSRISRQLTDYKWETVMQVADIDSQTS